jgi:CHAP domain
MQGLATIVPLLSRAVRSRGGEARVKRVKVFRSLVAAVMALGLVATLPGIATASAGSTIASVANRYVGYGACGLGGSGFASPSGSYSCAAGNPITGWCDEFAGFVWAKSGVVNTSGLGAGPGGFVTYNGLSSTPHVGDVAVMASRKDPPGETHYAHVAIVTAVSGASVTMVGGNEGGGQGIVARSYYTAGYYQRTPVDGKFYYVQGYVAPRLR